MTTDPRCWNDLATENEALKAENRRLREALVAVNAFWSADALGLPVHSPDDPYTNPQCEKVWRKVRAALAATKERTDV